MKKTVGFILLFISFFSARLKAQEMWGAAHSNYAGQMGVDLNPASIAGVPYNWEIHFLSMDAAILNNYMYLRGNSKLIRKSIAGETVDDERMTDLYTKTPDKFAYGSAFIKYPSFIWAGKKFSAGFHAGTRAEMSAVNVPYHLAKFLKEGFDYDGQQGISYSGSDVKAGLINWHELGLSAAMVIYDRPESYFTAGLTFNYNYGFNGYYVLLDQVDYNVPADTLLVVDNMDLTYGHAMPDDKKNANSDPLMNRGEGFSMNAGVQYFRNRNDAFFNPCARGKGDKPYAYKIGLSIVDAGFVNFTKDALNFRIDNRSTNWYGIDTVKFANQAYADSLLSVQFYGRYKASSNGRDFSLFLPTATSLQVDVPFSEHWFLNLTVIQRIPFGPLALRRSNQIAITPRFESRRFEFSLPVSYYDFFKPRVGVSFRFGIFTIGSDMISPLLGLTDSFGADLYLGITWKNFGHCGAAGRSRSGKRPNIENCKTPN